MERGRFLDSSLFALPGPEKGKRTMKKLALLSVWLIVACIARADHLICWVTNGVAVYQIGAPDGWDGGTYDAGSHRWLTPPAPEWITIESVSILESGPVDLSVPESLPWNHGESLGCLGSGRVRHVSNSAFKGLSSLRSVVVPDTVETIGYAAFNGCSALESMTLPFVGSSRTETIDFGNENAFWNLGNNGGASTRFCYVFGMESYANSYGAFYRQVYDYCYLPNSLRFVQITDETRIDPLSFFGCKGLESLVISGNVTSIGFDAFYGCSGVASITIPDSVTSIGERAFYGCSGLTSITIPNGVTNLAHSVFSGCSRLPEIAIPGSVETIDGEAFSGCCGLTNVTIGAGVGSIGIKTFLDCTNLTEITIPNSVTNLGNGIFGNCQNLQSISLPYCGWTLKDILSPVWSGRIVYYPWLGHERATFPASLTNIVVSSISSPQISHAAFFGCGPYVKFPDDMQLDGVTSIGVGAFSECTNLGSISIPEEVTEIGKYAFYGCSGLSMLMVPDSVTNIGDHVFSGCSGLETLCLPARFGSQSADFGIPKSCNVIFYTTTPPQITTTSLPGAVVNGAYQLSLTATGGLPPYQWTATGLPESLAISASGILSGTPREIGVFPVSISVSDQFDHVVSTQLTLNVRMPLRIVEDGLPCATVGTPYSFQLTASGGLAPYAWTLPVASSSAPPEWLSLSEDGVLSGTPDGAGSHSIGVVVVSADGQTTPGVFTLVVKTPPLAITTASLPDAQLYSSYNHGGMQMSASGGTPPYQWSAKGLPDGLELTAEGRLWGFPQEYGEFEIEFSVCDSLGNSVSSNLICTVNLPPLRIQTWSVPIADAGQPYSTRCLSADGGLPPYVWTVSGLPAGLSASADGRISGTTEMIGTYDIAVVVADSLGHSSSCDLELSVCDPDDRKVIFVDASSTAPDPDGRSWATAYADLQTAAGALSNGRNLILVAPGRYTFTYQTLGLDGNTELVSTGGATRTIIDMNWSYDYGIAEFRRIDGFTICNCSYVDPWDPDAIVENCIITNCIWDPTAVVCPCILRNCLVSGNNWSDWSYWSPIVEGSRIENCTFVGNVAPLAVDCVFLNSILWNSCDQDGNPVGPQDCFANCTFTNCLVQGWNAGMEGLGSFDADPLFVDPAAGDFRLQSGSPCIDAGLAGIAVWTNDLAGFARVSGWAVDLGAYEFQFAASETRTTPVPVPFEWMDAFSAMLANHGGDYETFGNATASNGVNKVWECYVTGLDPTSATNRFLAEIVFDETGSPEVKWSPDLGDERRYSVLGKTNLLDATWGPTNESTRFFRVKVSMP